MVDVQLRRRGIRDQRLLAVMERVPRHEFIPTDSWDIAYKDHPVPIGEGQTISQPYIVAAMVEWLRLDPTDRVLEVGTGTGYQAAILAGLAAEVVTIERQPRLVERAEWNFQRLGYRNIRVVQGDGSLGVAEYGPYTAIIAAAAAPAIPTRLTDQLAEGGRLVIPIGNMDTQVVELIRKVQGKLEIARMEAVRFVPMVGENGFPEQRS